ncbi:hypothetical protein BC830DRAFT_1173876 [Chytriomyces sp. MP71]|nr:hypothetical protein BC830DRAFT_1173876 [Chytriomyces sp. MP71]
MVLAKTSMDAVPKKSHAISEKPPAKKACVKSIALVEEEDKDVFEKAAPTFLVPDKASTHAVDIVRGSGKGKSVAKLMPVSKEPASIFKMQVSHAPVVPPVICASDELVQKEVEARAHVEELQ